MAILTKSYQRLGQAYLGTSGGNLYVRIYAKYSEQDIANNRTKVQYQSRAYYENSTYIYDAQGTGSVSGTSATTTSGSCTKPTTGETVIATTEAWVYHNDNGKKSISASGYLNFPNWGWSATASGSADLPTIARASSIAVSNYNLGQNISVTIGKKSSSFTSTLTYKIGNRTGTIVTKTKISPYVWEMSESLIKQIKQDNPKNKKVSAIIYCDTYSDDTKIGDTKSASFTLIIIDKPVIDDVSITETIELIKQYTSSIVKYLSVPKFNITATPDEGTTISKYKVEVGDKSFSSSSNGLTANNIQYSYLSNNIRKTKFIVTVTDARGNVSTEYPIEVDFIEYVKLAFNNTDIKFTRLNSISNYVKLHMTGYIYNGLIGETQNVLTLAYRYKSKSDTSATWSEYKELTATIKDNNTFIIDDYQFEEEFDYKDNFDIEFIAGDIFSNIAYKNVIKTSETIVKAHKNGLDVKNLSIKGNDIHSIGSILITTKNENPGNLFGGTWELINKEFKSRMADMSILGDITDLFTVNSTNATLNSFYVVRNGNTYHIRIGITTKVELSDTNIEVGTFNLENLGITRFPLTRYNYSSATDSGNAIALFNLTYLGVLTVTDVMSKTSGGSIPSGTLLYFDITSVFNSDFMLDSVCDRFYWKRTK